MFLIWFEMSVQWANHLYIPSIFFAHIIVLFSFLSTHYSFSKSLLNTSYEIQKKDDTDIAFQGRYSLYDTILRAKTEKINIRYRWMHLTQNWGWRWEILEDFLKETSLMKPERREPKGKGTPSRGKITCNRRQEIIMS